MSVVTQDVLARESQLVVTLEQLCQVLELTPTQHDAARAHYEAAGGWLAEADNPLLRSLTILPHGSVALGTTVKPHGRNEHDVDLMARITIGKADLPPATLKAAIGDRFRAHDVYAPLLEEKTRCWRLNYADEFHLDITPSIPNPSCANGGELVPDKELRCWKPSNPDGYRALFVRRAALQPRIRFAKAMTEDRATVAPFPRQESRKGILRRTVQLCKRHRDIHFERDNTGAAPISVVTTSLLAQAYELCVTAVYDTELQLIIEVIKNMPRFIEGPLTTGHPRWAVWNETTSGENFAEKWNRNPALPGAFFAWHAKLQQDMQRLTGVFGRDQLAKLLSESFGPRPVRKAMDALTEGVAIARREGRLVVARAVGLIAGQAKAATPVRPNTFFGEE